MTQEQIAEKIVDAIIKGWNDWSKSFSSRAEAERYWAKIIGEADIQADVMLSLPARSSRDWKEDFSHENGNYVNRCVSCKEGFFGHKRRVICKLCAGNGA